jgi:hypothetical protein
MTINISKPTINIREKLSELDFAKVPFQKMPSGSVLQVVYGTTSTVVTTATSTFIDSGLTANISPLSINSKVLILIDQLIFLDRTDGGAEAAGQLKVLRDTTDIFTTPAVNDLRITAEHAPSINELRLGQRISLNILDTPSTVSEITYKTQFNRTTAGTIIHANRSSSEARIILMEIAG